MIFKEQAQFSKKPTDLPDKPSPSYVASQIKEYLEQPSNELLLTFNQLVSDLNSSGWVDNSKLSPGAVGIDKLAPEIFDQPSTTVEVQMKLQSVDETLTKKAHFGNVVYVEDFPRIGTETDDTGRIQRAIDYAKANAMKAVIFALKIYNTSAPLKVYGGIALIGQHRTETKIISQGDIPTIASEGYFTPGVGSGDILIANLGVYPRGVTSKTKYGIEFVNTYNCLIKNIYLNESVMTRNDVGGIRFSKDATYTGPHFVNAVRESQLQNASIVVESTDSYLTDNEIWADKRSFAVHLIKSSQFLRGNQFVGSAVKGSVWIEDTKDGYDVELIRITDNYFDGNNQGLDTGMGINGVKVRLSRILGNDFWMNKDEGIKLVGSHSNTITANQFENNNRRDAGKDDILLDNCAANTLTGNTFKRDVTHTSKGSPIRTINSPGDRNIITNNTVYYTSFYNACEFSNKDTVRLNVGIPDTGLVSGLHAYLNGNLTATVAAETKLLFNAEVYDKGNEFSTSLGLFTASVSGRYTISTAIAFNAQTAGNRTILLVYKNGVGEAKLADMNSNNANSSIGGTITLDLVAGDTISIYYYTSGAAGIVGAKKETWVTINRDA